jgi:hypothetical protein
MADTSQCILYAGLINRDGYGVKGNTLVHRAMYEKHKGAIPKGLVIDHLCRVKNCINPDHLEAVTITVNSQRVWGINLCKRGHELTEENVFMNMPNPKTGIRTRKCRKCSLERTKRNREKEKLRNKGVKI